jgi:hypothetical protein
MKKLFLIHCFLFFATFAMAQKKDWGIGFRLGEPTGISIKKYFKKDALELNFGRAYWGRWGNKYYGYDDYNGNAFALQLHYVIQRQIKSVKGLDWYLALGGQFVSHSYKYKYSKNEWREYNDTDLGADFLVGLEYNFTETPLAIAAETGFFLELVDDPFYLRGIGGLAFRYNF